MKKLFWGLLLALSAFRSQAQTNLATEIEKLLPSAKCNVDVMGLAYPKRYLELAGKLQSVIETNKDWWLDYIKKNAKDGELLPYTSKFGLKKMNIRNFFPSQKKERWKKSEAGLC